MSRKTPALEFKLRLDESDFKTAVNKASSDFSRGLQGMTNHAQSQSRQITQALSNIQGFRDLKKQIQETETQLQEATGEVARLAREIQASEAPTRQMSRAFEQAKKRAKSLKDQFDGQRTSLHSLRGTLREAGIDTTRLGNNQKQLQNKMAEATREAKEQSRVIKAFSTIGVRSVREVETEVQRLRSAYRDLSRSGRVSATDLNRAHKKMKSRIRELRREMSGLNSSMTSMGASIKGLVGAYAGFVSLQAASGFIKDSILTFANFDDTMRQVGATSGATKKELKSLTELAKEMGASTRFSATQAAEGLKTMSLAGLSAKQQMAALPRVLELAAAGSVDMETAAGIATTALAQFGLKATDLAAVNNVLVTAFTSSATNIQDLGLAMQYAGPVAKAAGSNFKETATVLALLAKNGFSGEKAGTALRAAYARLLLPTKNAQKAIEKLGLKTRDASGELLPMTQILRNLRSTGADATAMIRIFGVEAAPALTSAVGMSSRAFEDLVNKFRDMGNVSADVAKKMEAGMGGSIRSLEAAWEGVKIAIGEAIDQSQTLQLKELVQYINQNKDAIVQLALAGVDLAAMLARVALEIGQFILKWQDTIVV
jgi:TP901 family phage tail tape measure protein